MTHLGLTNVDELRAYVRTQRRLRYLRVAELLLDDVEPKSESPMETRLRLTLVAGGLPRPQAQWEVTNADGAVMWRLDLAYVEQMVVVEYDGAWHWKQRRKDERRWTALRTLGWDVHVFDSDDVYGNPEGVVREVRTALSARRSRSAG
jgi:very-short-patch-repair endonuclease